MVHQNFVEEIAKRLSAAVPPEMKHLQEDLHKNFHSVLQGAFDKMHLVTREEFDAQTKVLARTRKKITELEHHVAALEEQLGIKTEPKKPTAKKKPAPDE